MTELKKRTPNTTWNKVTNGHLTSEVLIGFPTRVANFAELKYGQKLLSGRVGLLSELLQQHIAAGMASKTLSYRYSSVSDARPATELSVKCIDLTLYVPCQTQSPNLLDDLGTPFCVKEG